ncbi:MAG: hypothetical protein ACI92W_001076 [Paraglaciecola sp.]|jgi:hypothetical protein
MIRSYYSFPFLVVFFVFSCNEPATDQLVDYLKSSAAIEGSESYLASPYVAAGDRVYIVGHQDGTFPDLGWHVQNEMGGIWDHPIKLMDGYTLSIGIDGEAAECLPPAETFVNFPIGNQHTYPLVSGLLIDRFQIVPDGVEGVVIEYQIENNTDQAKDVVLQFGSMIDLRPVWLAERQKILDGKDIFYYDMEQQLIHAKDSLNPWFLTISSDFPIKHVTAGIGCQPHAGNGIDAMMTQEFSIDAGSIQPVRYFVAGSYQSSAEATTTNQLLKSSYGNLISAKTRRYEQLQQRNTLVTDDDGINQMYEWVRYNTDWLMRDVPEVGRGLSAGIPDYPWWFGTDNGYAIEGMLAYGMLEEAVSTIDLITRLSDDANDNSGQIMHEASTNGVVFNPGNLNTTPKFIHAMWQTYRWVGSDSLLIDYWPIAQRGVEWIEHQDKDGNGYPDGPGMMEIDGLHTEMIDVIAYLEQGYRAAAYLAYAVGETVMADIYLRKSALLIKKINSEWWVEDFQSFADFRSDHKQAVELIEAAIVRSDTINKPWSVEELQSTLLEIKGNPTKETSGYVVHHNWVVNTPMETGSADSEKALLALGTAQKYQNRFGMFVTGIDRDEAQEQATQWKAFSYVGAVMTLPTGVQAIAAANYGQVDLAYAYLKNLENSFSYALPGSMYEVSPDFGMIAQAWNAYAVAVPVVMHFFGIQPDAANKTVRVKLNLPSQWETASLERVRIGENQLTIRFELIGGKRNVTLIQTVADWKIMFDAQVNQIQTSEDGLINSPEGIFVLTGNRQEITY